MKYRSEIDGLRTIAVVPVIIFHAGFKHLTGGFVGVDIFFVISGYLITTILINELNTDSFSILRFYERRARRILPALFVVLAACTVASWWLLVPRDMRSFAQSLAATTAFASNIFFWQTSGYFDTATALKPLLHTWSLAVEEQYYIVFPPFLYLIWRFGKRHVTLVLMAIAILSIALSQYYSERKPSADFYLLPTRAWELMIGALVAVHYVDREIRKHQHRHSQIFSTVGLALICYSMVFFDNNTPFPSLYALAPTIGAALIIIFSTNDTIVGKILGSKPFVNIGLISYSAYLWHQPLFAFARIFSIGTLHVAEPGAFVMTALAIATFPLAYLSWRFVEGPFRNKHLFSRNRVFMLAFFGSTLIAGIGLIGYASDGFLNRYNAYQRSVFNYYDGYEEKFLWDKYRHICNFYNIKQNYHGNYTRVPMPQISAECYTPDPLKSKTVFLWGDSHAQMLYYGMKQELPSNYQVLQVASSGCRADTHAQASDTDYCQQSNWFALNKIRELKPDVVVIAQESGHNLRQMLDTADVLKSAGVGHTIFAGPAPHWALRYLPDLVAFDFSSAESIPMFSFNGIDPTYIELDRKLKASFPSRSDASYLSIEDSLCQSKGCRVYIGDNVMEGLTSWDFAHFTPVASEFFAKSALVPAILASH